MGSYFNIFGDLCISFLLFVGAPTVKLFLNMFLWTSTNDLIKSTIIWF